MLFGVGVSCRFLYSIVNYLYVSCSGSIASVGEERTNSLVIMWFLFGDVSSSSWCLGWAALYHCCTPWAFYIFVLLLRRGSDKPHQEKANNIPQNMNNAPRNDSEHPRPPCSLICVFVMCSGG